MGVSWTAEQRKVIDTRSRNLLVSAAAGSGKTAVLVERILTMITDEKHPVDIDRLLVVTFTNAAAAEMKNRVGEALEKRLEADPDNAHLRRQMVLIHHAKIMTIHSFCTYIIRNYFSRISLDPDFRIGEEGEMKLLQADVLQRLRDDAYESQSAEFQHFVDSYALGKADGGLEDYIMNLYEFAMSYPFPEAQLEAWRQDFAAGEQAEWLEGLLKDVHRKAWELMDQCEYGMRLCREEEGPYIYEEMLMDDWQLLKRLAEAKDYERVYQLLANHSFMPMSRKRPKDIDPDKKAAVMALRNQVKKHVQDMQKSYGVIPADMLVAEDASCRVAVDVLVSLALEFKKRFEQTKRDKNLLDFGDLEHLALEILLEKTDQGYAPSDVAQELSEYFEEILIDEYQDSNLLQETLLTAVSGLREGRFNIFQVGDVKQSIYRFRLARPELFMEKYHGYPTEDEKGAACHCQRIDLHRNFRSRPEVLDSTNRVFAQIMGESLGGIEYDEAAALYQGRSVLDVEGCETELCLIAPEDKGILDDLNERELEAMAVARRIKEMTQPGNRFLKSEANPEGVDLRYKDVAILLRSYGGWAEVFAEALSAEGIPAFIQSKTGYFDTLEVATALNFLRIIDNPRQDIPLAAVLLSPIGGLTTEELARMKAGYREALKQAAADAAGQPGTEQLRTAGTRSEAELYDAFLWCEAEGQGELQEKLARFGRLWRRMRSQAQVRGTYDLLNLALTESRYDLFVAAMPGGQARSANLEMLKQKAIDYEATSYHGLFDFIRYIENLRKYEMDFGEAPLTGENENAVRIYSIHKSKGLEFPVCFVAGLSKAFNQSDSRQRILLHAELGVATDVVDPELRTRRPSLRKKVMANQLRADSLGEELRVLYVAMTRAREKLILTAVVDDAEEALEKQAIVRELPGKRVPYTYLIKARSYLDWLIMAWTRDPDAFAVRALPFSDLMIQAVERQTFSQMKREQMDDSGQWQLTEEEKKELDERLAFQYPYEKAVRMYRKMSVSDLKKQGMEEADGHVLFPGDAPEGVPEAVAAEEAASGTEPSAATGLTGSDRGTAYHRLLECLNFGRVTAQEDVCRAKEELLAAGKMAQAELDCVDEADIFRFLRSPLGVRMTQAEARGELKRESQFVMGVSSEELGMDLGTDETLLIQGIMDACFLEDGSWILMDYKTDRVPYHGGEEILRKRYQVQLDYYKRALEQMTERPVRECWIYSFALHRAIIMD